MKKPQILTDAAKNFGSQCVVLAIDAKLIRDEWFVFLNGGFALGKPQFGNNNEI